MTANGRPCTGCFTRLMLCDYISDDTWRPLQSGTPRAANIDSDHAGPIVHASNKTISRHARPPLAGGRFLCLAARQSKVGERDGYAEYNTRHAGNEWLLMMGKGGLLAKDVLHIYLTYHFLMHRRSWITELESA